MKDFVGSFKSKNMCTYSPVPRTLPCFGLIGKVLIRSNTVMHIQVRHMYNVLGILIIISADYPNGSMLV